MKRAAMIGLACTLAVSATAARADEGGVSMWLPGQFGSLAAAPGTPGWSFASVYYHTSVSAGGGKQFNNGGSVRAGLNVRGDLIFLNATYIFTEPFLGAQAAIGLTG